MATSVQLQQANALRKSNPNLSIKDSVSQVLSQSTPVAPTPTPVVNTPTMPAPVVAPIPTQPTTVAPTGTTTPSGATMNAD